MKIGIITHHDVHNHGAQLQLYALIKVLESLGHNASALTYTKNYDFLDKSADKKYNITLKSVSYYLNYMRINGIKKTFFNINKKNLLDQFRTEEKLVNGYYSKTKDLDCVFIGSDEVFSIEPGLNPFFWGMGVPSENVFSYAASFGPTTYEFIEEKNAIEFVTGGVSRLKEIAVRDENSKDIISKLTDKHVQIVCDPVILYGFNNETMNMQRPIKNNYMVIYSYDKNMNNSEEVKHIVSYAKKHNLKIVSVGFYHKWCDLNINASPFELINWVKYAHNVVTDTFHGSVISIIMNRTFVAKIRGNRNKLEFLLEEYELSDREIIDFSEISTLLNNEIDYEKVNLLMEEKKQQSLDYIVSCLENVNNDK